MNLKSYRNLFSDTLKATYPKTEIDSFFFILIEEFLDLKRIDFTLNPDFLVSKEALEILNKSLKRLQLEEPIQYILGSSEFYGLPFLVNKHTLIPRPETEELVDWILSELQSNKVKRLQSDKISILDIGTGSGCIAISLAKHLPKAEITAVDVSENALKMANKNAELNKVHINFKQLNILEVAGLPKNFDIIVSNPPYVRSLEKSAMKNNVLQNEPETALFVSDENPLLFYDKIADLAKTHLTKNGLLFFEINQYLGTEMLSLLSKKEFNNIQLKKDLFGNDRMIKAKISTT